MLIKTASNGYSTSSKLSFKYLLKIVKKLRPTTLPIEQIIIS